MATVVTNLGLARIVSKLRGSDTTTYPQYIGWGTGAGTAAKTDTTLFTEAAEARITGTMSAVTTTATGDTFQITGTMTSASSQTITNVGVFNASSAGELFIHADFSGVPTVSGDSIAFTIKDALA